MAHGGLPDFSHMQLEYCDENDLMFSPTIFSLTIMVTGQKIHADDKTDAGYKEIPLEALLARLPRGSYIIPTRRVKSISKLFCIEDLIRRSFI